MLLGMVMITFSSALASSALVPSASGNSGDAFSIDVKLKSIPNAFILDKSENWYKFPNNNHLDLSNSSIVCPSNQCKSEITPDNTMLLVSDRVMTLGGDLQLVDDKSNGHLTPKKQKLIEQMNLNFFCKYQDIQEDIAKKTTKYICSEPQDGSIRRNFNDTTHPYTFTATFELPSRHLVLNATEAHQNPYFLFSGHLVFRNEDGKIEVK